MTPESDDPFRTARDPVPVDGGSALPAGTFLGEFEIKAILGEGGFGIVYLALDHSLGREVAIKEYMPQSLATRVGVTSVRVRAQRFRDPFEAGLKSFLNEARLLARFDHRSLVKVHRFWEAQGTAYMAMPYYKGETLSAMLARYAPPNERWLLDLLDPLTEALGVLHAEHCYHRDIAPDNVMLPTTGSAPVLLDFGAARHVIGNMTQLLTVILKPGYAPIEQYSELPAMKQGPWTDIYALGALVHFAIHGNKPPFAVDRLVEDRYVPLVESAAGRYSTRFLRAVDHALALRPEDRPQSMAQFRTELGLGGLYAESAAAAAGLASGASKEPKLVVDKPIEPPSPDKPVVARAKSPTPIWMHLSAAALALVAIGTLLYWKISTDYQQVSVARAAEQTTIGVPKAAPEAAAPAPAPATPPAPAPSPAPTPAPAPAPTPAPAPANPVATPPAATIDALLPPAAGPRDIKSEFERIVAEQSPGYAIRALPAKATVQVDRDRLFFNVQSAKAGFLYVFLLSDGTVTQIFPTAKVPSYRLRERQWLGFPQPGWGPLPRAVDTVGPKQILALVSRFPRQFVETSGTSDDGFKMIGYPSNASSDDSIFKGKPICENDGECKDDYGAAVMNVNVVR